MQKTFDAFIAEDFLENIVVKVENAQVEQHSPLALVYILWTLYILLQSRQLWERLKTFMQIILHEQKEGYSSAVQPNVMFATNKMAGKINPFPNITALQQTTFKTYRQEIWKISINEGILIE